ncbi:MAG: SPASM domain-containing protein [bacterium]
MPVVDTHCPVSCSAGTWGLHITHRGEVYPCGFAIELGNRKFLAGIVSKKISLLNIWQNSEVLHKWRHAGKSLEYQNCLHYGRGCWGGCMVNAWAYTGALSAMDPYCPLHKSNIKHLQPQIPFQDTICPLSIS